MDHHHHHMHNPPLHWGYSGTPPHHNTWVPPQTRSITSAARKRQISESDCEDLYSETSSSKDQTSPKESDSCQHQSRKKRRGVIEKKRRDRINVSLTELKRLVPSAYEKQGSAKLEKAEILQLTVDHLKMLHAKGIDNMAYDPQRFAIDYHNIGFRECVAEVARYLLNHEGMDIQDPLRMRLMSHLQCFVAQRELNAKPIAASPSSSATAANTPASWSSPLTPSTAYPHVPAASSAAASSTAVPNYPLSYGQNYPTHTPLGGGYVPNMSPTAVLPTSHHRSSLLHATTSPNHNTTSSNASPLKPSDHLSSDLNAQNQQHQQHHQHQQQQQQNQQQQQQQQQQHQQHQHQQHAQQQQHHYTEVHDNSHQQESHPVAPTYIDISESRLSTDLVSGYSHYPAPGSAQTYNPAAYSGSKPYRPWGAEMAY